MPLRDDLEQKLRSLHLSRAAMPNSVQASDASGVTVRLELTVVDSMSCAFSELVLFVPQLQTATFAELEQWANDLAQRVTYLLEKIGPLELDPAQGQILIRSTPPTVRPHGTEYYEVLLTSSGNGSFTLRRFQSIAGQPGRTPADVQVTHEVLFRLIDDLLATIPATP
ncbi:hypothetical protein SH661x_001441 [Planctomicrobium sp. SH661]|uniref:hypothetical protein n=1 Tax=Planctomicrobium sp. SH661 TaxID=3448124 RepID=UPI003F5C5756